MSMDKSLKSKNLLQRHRNVLTRAERLEKLKEQDRWNDGDSVFGLPKVRVQKLQLRKKKKVKKEEEEEEGEGGEETTQAES